MTIAIKAAPLGSFDAVHQPTRLTDAVPQTGRKLLGDARERANAVRLVIPAEVASWMVVQQKQEHE